MFPLWLAIVIILYFLPSTAEPARSPPSSAVPWGEDGEELLIHLTRLHDPQPLDQFCISLDTVPATHLPPICRGSGPQASSLPPWPEERCGSLAPMLV